jgi:hypothetical protein
MDNDILVQLKNQLHMDAHHAAEEAVNSPMMVNRMVGEAMRHIGGVLEVQSAAYLPVRPDEILVKPIKAFNNDDALVLVNRTLPSSNAFIVLVNISQGEGDKKNFDLFAFQINNYRLTESKIIKLNEAIGNEIIRQVIEMSPTYGGLLVQCVILSDYFKNQAPVKVNEEELFSADVNAEAAPTQLPPVSKLPPVTNPEPVKPSEPTSVLPPVVDGSLL